MLPSRGLRPAQCVPLSARQRAALRCNASRKFSSLPRSAGLCAPSCRTSPLQSARWRTGAAGRQPVVLTGPLVRNGSWYAPWSWGKSSTPSADAPASGVEQVRIAEFAHDPAPHHIEAAVTSTTPELASAGTDSAPVVDSTAEATSTGADSMADFNEAQTIDALLGLDPANAAVAPIAELDPTSLIDHTGQLKELGLDYGWGITTVFERAVELIYLNTGFGWGATIMLSAVAVRCCIFTFQALTSDRMAALALLKPLTQPLQDKLTIAIAQGDKQAEHVLKMQQARIMKPHMGGVFSMGGFMVMQGWIGYCAFRCLRAMAALPVPGLENDGFFWFKDLTVSDPYYLIPATITGIFYFVFNKLGGETGVSNDAMGQGETRKLMMTGLAFVIGGVTAFQPVLLQLYFLVTGTMGGITSYLLRQNPFRRLIGIRPLPSKESEEVYTKVVKGEVKLSQVKSKDGKVRYQAPTAPQIRRSGTPLPGIKIREGMAVPAHLKVEEPAKTTSEHADRDEDFEAGPQGTALQKLDYYRRNYRLAYMRRRIQGSLNRQMQKYGLGNKGTEAQQKRKKRAEQYEIERRRRFENRQ